MIVKADKTNNLYKIPVHKYKSLLLKNVTTEYKKSDPRDVKAVNYEAAKIAGDLDIANRVDTYIEAGTFITIKDHKPNFPGKVECRLLNPAKSNLGKISKMFLDKAIIDIKIATQSNQWKNSGEVITWFKSLQDKQSLKFFKFDVVSFYPSVKESLFNETLDWARKHTALTDDQENHFSS